MTVLAVLENTLPSLCSSNKIQDRSKRGGFGGNGGFGHVGYTLLNSTPLLQQLDCSLVLSGWPQFGSVRIHFLMGRFEQFRPLWKVFLFQYRFNRKGRFEFQVPPPKKTVPALPVPLSVSGKQFRRFRFRFGS